MIKDVYVSFEVARLLKEKGFEQHKCRYSYNSKGVFKWSDDLDPYEYSAPTHQMAMKWLREHKIYIMIDRSWSMEDSWQYCICVNNDFDHLIQQDSIPNRTYEEAVESALKYCLENLI